MVPLDAMTIVLLCTAFCYAMASLYVLCMVLRPLLTTAINGLIDLARLAIGCADGRDKHKAHGSS